MAETPEQPKLTTKQQLFIAAYLGDARGNATEAARMAGYAHPRQAGTRLLSNAVISARVSGYIEAKFAGADDVLTELTDVAMAPWRDFVEVLKRDPKTGKPLMVKFDLAAKMKGLELLGKYHQLFVERVDITGDLGVTYELVGIDPEEMP